MKRAHELPVTTPALRAAMPPPAAQASEQRAWELSAQYPEVGYETILRGCLWLAQYSDELMGRPERAPRLYDCHVCLDRGLQVSDSDDHSEAYACQRCDRGLSLEAATWLNAIKPIGKGERRYPSRRGQAQFDWSFRHRPERRKKVEQRMQELEFPPNTKPKGKEGWE